MSLSLNVVRIPAIVAVLWGALFVPALTFAQDAGVAAQARGVTIGTVTDATKQRLPGVTVTIKTAAGVRTVVTDVQGRYRIAGLPLGTHRVVAALPGFTLTAKETELTPRYPESDASFVMYVGELESTETVPGPPRYRVWPLRPESR